MRESERGKAYGPPVPGFRRQRGRDRIVYTSDSCPVSLSDIDSERREGFEEVPAGADCSSRGRILEGVVSSGKEKVRIVLRQYKHGGLFSFIAGALFFSPRRACEELEGLGRLMRRGLAVPEPVFLEIRKHKGLFFRMWLATRKIEGGVTLFRFFKTPPSGDGSVRRKLLEKLALSVHGMHEAGVEHGDLHAGNVLISDPKGGMKVVLLDFDGCVVRDYVPPARRWKNVLRFDRSLEKHSGLSVRFSRSERYRFLVDYLRLSGGDKKILKRRLFYHKLSLALHRLSWRAAPSSL